MTNTQRALVTRRGCVEHFAYGKSLICTSTHEIGVIPTLQMRELSLDRLCDLLGGELILT